MAPSPEGSLLVHLLSAKKKCCRPSNALISNVSTQTLRPRLENDDGYSSPCACRCAASLRRALHWRVFEGARPSSLSSQAMHFGGALIFYRIFFDSSCGRFRVNVETSTAKFGGRIFASCTVRCYAPMPARRLHACRGRLRLRLPTSPSRPLPESFIILFWHVRKFHSIFKKKYSLFFFPPRVGAFGRCRVEGVRP